MKNIASLEFKDHGIIVTIDAVSQKDKNRWRRRGGCRREGTSGLYHGSACWLACVGSSGVGISTCVRAFKSLDVASPPIATRWQMIKGSGRVF
jgi:hypothetical protein